MGVQYTGGRIEINIASSAIHYNVEAGIVIEGTIPKEQPPKQVLPNGLAWLVVTSPEGWLSYEEVGGVHTFKMTDELVKEPDPPHMENPNG